MYWFYLLDDNMYESNMYPVILKLHFKIQNFYLSLLLLLKLLLILISFALFNILKLNNLLVINIFLEWFYNITYYGWLPLFIMYFVTEFELFNLSGLVLLSFSLLTNCNSDVLIASLSTNIDPKNIFRIEFN